MSNREKVKEAFGKIHADNELKNNTREFIIRKTDGYRKNNFFPYKQAAMIMACFLFIILGQRGYSAYFTSVSTISIDVNPSIEFDVNQFEKVIDVKSYNEDGDVVISNTDVRYLDYRKALEKLLQNESMTPYLAQEQLVVITVFGEDEQKNTEMLADLTACTGSYKNVHCSAGNSHDVSEAHSLGLSYGKYKAFLELQALYPDITIEDVSGLTMHQIWDMINELSNDVDNPVPDSDTGEDGDHGLGHGHQHRYGQRNGNDSN